MFPVMRRLRYNHSVNNTRLKLAARILFVICVPFFLLTLSISIAANCKALYTHGFRTYDISVRTGLAPEELDKAAAGLIGYWNSGEDYIDITVLKAGEPFTLFNDREVGHLKDVKDLFRLGYKVCLGTFLYILVFVLSCLFWWRDRRNLGMGFLWGGGLTVVIMVVLGIVIAVDFDGFFLRFHLLSFANDLWQLNPATDYLIMMFPQGFWFDAALYVSLATLAGALLLGVLGWWMVRKP